MEAVNVYEPAPAATGRPDAIFRRRPDVLSRRTPNSAIVCPRGAGGVTILTGSGVLLWDMLAEPKSLGETVDAMAKAYGVTGDVVKDDIARALDNLMNRRVIERS